MEQAVKENSITQGVIWKQLLIFFFPILIGTFFQQLYNTVDTIVVGQYVGTNALAAVGTTGTLINLLVGFFVGVSSGATVIISQFFGAGDGKNVSKAAAHLHCLGLGGRTCHHGAGAADGSALFGAAGRARGDTGRRLDLHERVLLRHHRQHDIQRGHRRAAGHWRQPHAPIRAHCLLPGEHCAGPALCAGLPLGRVRRGHCHGALPGGQRGAYHGAADAHPGELPGGAQTHPL